MTKDYARGYFDAMERAIQWGRAVEGDCGEIETTIINDPEYQEADRIVHGLAKETPKPKQGGRTGRGRAR